MCIDGHMHCVISKLSHVTSLRFRRIKVESAVRFLLKS
jgi:hypothetical protein